MEKSAERAMRPTLPNKIDAALAQSCKGGYSLIEILIVLAIMAIGSAIALPRAASALDQVIAHTVLFEFQRQVSEIRAQAFREERTLVIVNNRSLVSQSGVDADSTVFINLRSGWTYQFNHPLAIAAGGSCSTVIADIRNGERTIMHLESGGHNCQFIRIV